MATFFYIYMTAISPNLISGTIVILLSWELHGCKMHVLVLALCHTLNSFILASVRYKLSHTEILLRLQ